MKLIEIFRAGKHTTMAGNSIEFTNNDLESTVFAYANEVIKAPIVLGHPIDDKPVYGWVDKLSLNNGTLIAHVNEISQDLIDAVRTGHYKYVSASFHTPIAKSNPFKGAYYLKHVGVLGAMSPAVKGLAALDFSESFTNSIPLRF